MKLIPGEWRYFDDSLGIAFPWYTSTCLEWLNTFDFSDKAVFEFGCGFSTKWYRTKGAYVAGVDSEGMWLRMGDSVSIMCADTKEKYIGYIDECFNKKAGEDKRARYDFIIIDGDYRDDCTEPALRALKNGGFLIIDNYMQESFECDWTKTKELIKDMDQVLFKEPDHPSGWATLVVKK